MEPGLRSPLADKEVARSAVPHGTEKYLHIEAPADRSRYADLQVDRQPPRKLHNANGNSSPFRDPSSTAVCAGGKPRHTHTQQTHSTAWHDLCWWEIKFFFLKEKQKGDYNRDLGAGDLLQSEAFERRRHVQVKVNTSRSLTEG